MLMYPPRSTPPRFAGIFAVDTHRDAIGTSVTQSYFPWLGGRQLGVGNGYLGRQRGVVGDQALVDLDAAAAAQLLDPGQDGGRDRLTGDPLAGPRVAGPGAQRPKVRAVDGWPGQQQSR